MTVTETTAFTEGSTVAMANGQNIGNYIHAVRVINLPIATGYVVGGCTFGGWTSSIDNYAKVYPAGYQYTIPRGTWFAANVAIRFKAVWVSNRQSVFFETTGGDVGVSGSVTNARAGADIKLPAATRFGYVFEGWRDTQTGVIYPEDAVITVRQSRSKFIATWHADVLNNDPTRAIKFRPTIVSGEDGVISQIMVGGARDFTLNPLRVGETITLKRVAGTGWHTYNSANPLNSSGWRVLNTAGSVYFNTPCMNTLQITLTEDFLKRVFAGQTFEQIKARSTTLEITAIA
jgi:uncharacterized repeat protein (TIGR02543 family)